MLFLDSIDNILDVFLKSVALLLILEIPNAVFLINKSLFQFRVISKVQDAKLNNKVRMHPNVVMKVLRVFELIL